MDDVAATEPLRFDDRVVLVTGAGRGIGRAHARLLASRGAKVVVNDLGVSLLGSDAHDAPADEVVAEVVAAGGTAVADTSDVATPEGAAAAVQTALDTFGGLDVVIANAGFASAATRFDELTPDQIDGVLGIHLRSPFLVLLAAWPTFVAQQRGRVLLTSSSTALGVENSWDYPAAKGGVQSLARSLAIRARHDGITVNAIMPMAYTRPMHRYPKEDIRAWMEATFRPEQVAAAAAFLVHDEVPCTGEVFLVGGGQISRVVTGIGPGMRSAGLTPEEVRERFAEVMSLDPLFVALDSRDSSRAFQGDLAWDGDDSDYGR